MAPDFALGQGDNNVTWSYPLYDRDGNRRTLAPGSTVKLHFRRMDETDVAVEQAGTVTADLLGSVLNFVFLTAHTVAAGDFNAKWIVTEAAGGAPFSEPANRELYLLVERLP